ncbi:MAG TPA: aldo/keto reductase [Vicinamibacterales bacterium]|nr:aldo/keto reductase [Vicinamibacterales bacterium]
MPLTDYVTLGRSGLRVSPFCLGAMTFGEDWGWGSSPAEAASILGRFLGRGGNFIDTANVYTKGHSEAIIGEAIGSNRARRDRIVIATKFFGNLYPGDPNGGGAGRKSIVSACEQSLRRLKTDYIDLYWMHAWDHHTPMDETMRALDDLVRGGKVRYVGFSDTPAWKVVEAQMLARQHNATPVTAIQISYSLVERTVEGDLIPMAREFGLGVTPWSPLAGGVLSGKYTRANAAQTKADRGERVTSALTERNYAIIDVLIKIANELNTTPAAVALAWVQTRPGVTSTIIGARRVDQLEQNLAALDLTLEPSQVEALNRVSAPALNFPAGFLQFAPSFMHAGATVNGEPSQVPPMMPRSDAERY